MTSGGKAASNLPKRLRAMSVKPLQLADLRSEDDVGFGSPQYLNCLHWSQFELTCTESRRYWPG